MAKGKKKIRYANVRALNPGFSPQRAAHALAREGNPRDDLPVPNFPNLPGKYRARYFDVGKGMMIDYAYDDRVLSPDGREAYLLPDGRWLSGVRKEKYGNLLQRRTTSQAPRWVTQQLQNGPRRHNPCDTDVTHFAIEFEGDEPFVAPREQVLAENRDDPEVFEALSGLRAGETVTLGGGAAPYVTTTALAGPHEPEACCTACSVGRTCGSTWPPRTSNPSPDRVAAAARRIARGGR